MESRRDGVREKGKEGGGDEKGMRAKRKKKTIYVKNKVKFSSSIWLLSLSKFLHVLNFTVQEFLLSLSSSLHIYLLLFFFFIFTWFGSYEVSFGLYLHTNVTPEQNNNNNNETFALQKKKREEKYK